MSQAPKWFFSVRWKFLLFVFSSAMITAALLYLGFEIGDLILNKSFGSPTVTSFIRDPLIFAVHRIGSSPVAVVVGIVVYTVSFFLFSKGTIRRLESIDQSIRSIGMGNS